MKEYKINFTYEQVGDSHASYIYLKEMKAGEAVKQIPIDVPDFPGELILDLDKDGKLIGIEILGDVIPDELKGEGDE